MISATVVEQYGDVPAARFGQSTTYMNNNTVIMFGGAVGDSGKFAVTSDIYSFEVRTHQWRLLSTMNAPTSRAAHAACCVGDNQLALFGGASGGGALSSEELYLLDLRKDPNLVWMVVPIKGPTPGRRYGHTLVCDNGWLVVFGGNNGYGAMNDAWVMNSQSQPFHWVEIDCSIKPSPRVYHAAAICPSGPATGMMVVYGGRNDNGKSLNDIWGFRQHRDGTRDWIPAPSGANKHLAANNCRYQHCATFIGTRMAIVGGRSDADMGVQLPTCIYDTNNSEWTTLDPIPRFRHSLFAIGNMIYIYGGFNHDSHSLPTNELSMLDIDKFMERAQTDDNKIDININGINRIQQGTSIIRSKITPAIGQSIITHKNDNNNRDDIRDDQTNYIDDMTGPRDDDGGEIRLASHVAMADPYRNDFAGLVRRVAIDQLETESKRIKGTISMRKESRGYLTTLNEDNLYDCIIKRLLRPNLTEEELLTEFCHEAEFCLSINQIKELCINARRQFLSEQTLLRLRAPIKLYGDIHGQYFDLMRLFNKYKAPINDEIADELNFHGDIDSVDYLFLGDYVDRGTHSLEVICLLLALKMKYPKQIHMIRGNHEDEGINMTYGFQKECKIRINEDPLLIGSCYKLFNSAFEALPCGGLINNRVLCIHGGIGASIQTIKDISSIQRPYIVEPTPKTHEQQIVTDLLWSDPTENDNVLGVIPNVSRDPEGTGHIYCFGPDRVIKFLKDNKLDLIIRAHECVQDGFERFAQGSLITVFSATNYCNSYRNAGALLFIRKDLTIVPKLIHPFYENNLPTWDERLMTYKPPTPLRTTPGKFFTP